MTNKNYRRGYVIERKVVNMFRDQGYLVIRSAGSHSAVDVCVFKDDKAIAIQLKREKKKTNHTKEIEDFKKVKVPAYMQKEFWIYRDHNRKDPWLKYTLP